MPTLPSWSVLLLASASVPPTRRQMLLNWRSWVLLCVLVLALLPFGLRWLPAFQHHAPVKELHKWQVASQVKNDGLGFAVALDGQHALVGAYHHTATGAQSGTVFSYRLDAQGEWQATGQVVPPDGKAGDWFGFSLALQGNLAAIGALKEDSRGADAGAVYIFRYVAGKGWCFEHKLTAPDGRPNDAFGLALALDDGRVLAGAHRHFGTAPETGAAYVFQRQTDSAGQPRWDAGTKLNLADEQWRDRFGFSVALSGDTALVGSYLRDVHHRDDGAVYLFRRSAEGSWRYDTQLTAADGGREDWFGHSVALDGDTALVGSTFERTGSDGWAQRYTFLKSGKLSTGGGAAYVFQRDGEGHWLQQQKLTAFDAFPGDGFGIMVALRQNHAFISAYREDPAVLRWKDWELWERPDAGSVYVYRRDAAQRWQGLDKFTASDVDERNWFGFSLAVDGTHVLAGAPFDNSAGESSGAAYLFRRTD